MVTYKGKQKEEKLGGKVATHPPRGEGGERGTRIEGGSDGNHSRKEPGLEKESRGENEMRVRKSERRRGERERRSREKRTKVSRKSKCESSPGAGIAGCSGGGGVEGREGRLVVRGSRSSTKLRMKVKRRRVEGLGFSLASTLIKD